MPRLAMDVQVASEAADVPAEQLFRKWARATLRVDTEIALRIVDEEEGRALNRDYLTFPLTEEPHLMGDIILCAPVVAREAVEQGKPLEAHYAHLTVHGVLHLHGYDHETEPQAELMEGLETEIVTKLGYSDPYAAEKIELTKKAIA